MRSRVHPERDDITLLTYGAYACVGFLINGLGPILPFLQADLGVTRGDVAWYPLLFAAGLVAIGLVGDRIVGAGGRRSVFWLAVGGTVVGSLVISAAASPIVTGVGAGLMGLGAALLILLVPAILSDRHGRLAAGALSEANAVSSGASILAPLLVSAAMSSGAGWQAGFVVVPLALALLLVAISGRRPIPDAGAGMPAPAHAGPVAHEGSYVRRWLDLVLVVSVEFCLVLWSTEYLISEIGVERDLAPAVASLFLVGMALGRLAGGQISERLTHPRPVFVGALAVAAAGFVLFWAFRTPVTAGAGLLVAGLGVSLLYPISIARALRAWPDASDRAAARGALASGIAIGSGPFVLAMLADRVGIQAAYLVVPALLALAAANSLAEGFGRNAVRSAADRPIP